MKERISSFLDGELNQREAVQLISKLHENKDLRAVWGRYNTYSSAMRNELSSVCSPDFSDRVMQVLAKEPVQFSPAALPGNKRIFGPVVGLAVAASLIGIAILVQKPVLQDQTDTSPSRVAVATTPPLPTAPEKYELIVANSKNENVRERINRLLVEHNEYNPASDMTGIWSYSRFVGYNSSTDLH